MYLIASQALKPSRTLIDVARELSLSLAWFDSAARLEDLMSGRARRIVLISGPDIVDKVLSVIGVAATRAQFGLVITAEREALEMAGQARQLARLDALDNVEWIGSGLDFDQLSTAARACRRRLLRVSRKDLENAIINREFVLRYQPKVERSADTEWRTCEAEALLRWNHPAHGLVGPLEFLPEVEAFDLMGPVSEFVLREAGMQLTRWRDRGLQLNCCINLASSLLTDMSLPDRYAGIVGELGLECSSFTFEVAEQDLHDTDAPHLRTLKALREKGFRLCLDNFRVAVASLGTFEQLPFDEIKIHASGLKRAQADPVAHTVLAAVTGLAHNLGMSVCAEGVEDQETFEFLETIECDKMQGFLISEAVMPDILRKVYGRDDDSSQVA
jgi:EAL domain-containing protein (putative c-di-GMP-specific phosphodiesterase class I)